MPEHLTPHRLRCHVARGDRHSPREPRTRGSKPPTAGWTPVKPARSVFVSRLNWVCISGLGVWVGVEHLFELPIGFVQDRG